MLRVLSCVLLTLLGASAAHAEPLTNLDPTRTSPRARTAMEANFIEGQITLSKDETLVAPLKKALQAVDATRGKSGGCWPNRRLAISCIAAAARSAFKVPLTAKLQPVLDALAAATPGKEGHAAVVTALETALGALENAGGGFLYELRRVLKYLKDKDCNLKLGSAAKPAEAAAPTPPPLEFPELDPKKTSPRARTAWAANFVEGQIPLSKDESLVAPLLKTLQAVDAAKDQAGGCWPNRRLAISCIAAAARSAFKVPLTAKLQPVLDALAATSPGKEGHAAVVAAVETALGGLENAGGGFAYELRRVLKYLKDKDCNLTK
jgi:hypothetical protein